MFRPIHPDYAVPLAELALFELARAGAGELPVSGRSEAAIIADALGVPVALLAAHSDGPFKVEATAGLGTVPLPPTVAADGVLAEALARGSCVDVRPVPPALAAAGVQGGLAVRVGSETRPLALLVALAPDRRPFDADARSFLQGAAAALSARYGIDETRHALEESRARARAIVQTTVDGVITIDDRGRIDTFNDGAVRIFGYTPDEVDGRSVSMLMPEPYHSEHDSYLAAYRETGRRRIIGIGREVVGRRKSGATFPMDLAVSEVTLPDGETLFTGLVRDLTDHRVLEREVLRVAEAERRRIGQDLHDSLGQEITAVGLFLRTHARALDAEGSAGAAEAHRLVALVDDADRQARTLARSLVPVELEANGLEAALTRLAERAGQMYGLAVRAETTGSGPAEASALTADAATNLYRIAQEALSNAAQHGQAHRVTLALVRGTEHLRLRVEDDGVGLDGTLRRGGILEPRDGHGAAGPGTAGEAPERVLSAPARPADQRGMGLRIMHYRAHLAGGALEIRPGAEGGTVVTCTIPLRGPGFLGDGDDPAAA